MKKIRIVIILMAIFAVLCACKDDKKITENNSSESSEISNSTETSQSADSTDDNGFLTSEVDAVSAESGDEGSSEDANSFYSADSSLSSDIADISTSRPDVSNNASAGDDSSTASTVDDSSNTPISKDDSSVVPPPKDDSSIAASKDDSSVAPPEDNSSVAPPKDDSSIAPPKDESSAAPPADDSSEAPPVSESSSPDSSVVNECTVINTGGEHTLKGNVECPVIIETEEEVTLILNNATLNATNGPAIYVINAKQMEIQLVGTNTVADGTSYSSDYADVAKAALFSEDSLVFSGNGSLLVTGKYKHAIACDDDIIMNGGNITVVSAVTDAVHVNDAFEINGGKLTVKSAGSDGIQSEQQVLIKGGTVDITATGTGNAIKTSNNTGLLCDITISGGTVKIKSANDALRSNDTINITGGTTTIDSGNDGIQADVSVIIGGGKVSVVCANDGIKSKTVSIKDGDISVSSDDDGINASLVVSGSVGVEEGVSVIINGGKLYINASGDGIDSNGTLTVSGGYIAIDGPTSGMDGMIDVEGTQLINGGFLVGCDTGDMLDTPSSSSKQCVAVLTGQSFKASSSIAVTDSNGNVVFCYTFKKSCSAITMSAPKLISGGSYIVYNNVTVKGTVAAGGLYCGTSVSFTGGTVLKTFTQSTTVMMVN